MASATKSEEKIMGTDLAASGADEPERGPQQRAERSDRPGFFSIYKKGQGYWTRLGSAGGALLLVALTAHFLYTELPANIPWFLEHPNWKVGIVAGFVAGASLLIWRMMNKPDSVDFLIATDSEMKKVNWTSRQELMGSTKVVILFMVVIAASLFVIDVLFGYLFWLLDVLKSKPF